MPRIFISYRRQDSLYTARLIAQQLRQHFGQDAVFFDEHTIILADNFERSIVQDLSQCQLVLVVMGKQWLPSLIERQQHKEDWVRRELEAVLAYNQQVSADAHLERKIDIAPIFIDETLSPTSAELPPSLQGIDFSKANGLHVLSRGVEDDVKTLVGKVEQRLVENDCHQFQALVQQQVTVDLDQSLHQRLVLSLKNLKPRSNRSYALQQMARWFDLPQPAHVRQHLYQSFVELILFLDQGKEHEAGQFVAQDTRFSSLMQLLQQRDDFALVLLGVPGSGKSTLLRHLAYQYSQAFVLASDKPQVNNGKVTYQPFFVALNTYPDNLTTAPFKWLCQCWQEQYPRLPELKQQLSLQPMLLLLDALNEMPGKADDYREKVMAWRQCLAYLHEHFPQTRVVFSCRSMDYSAPLSEYGKLPVPQVNLADLSDEKIQEYLNNYLPEQGSELYQQLQQHSDLRLVNTPFYLNLAIELYQAPYRYVAKGPSAMIAGMLWLALKHELQKVKDKRSLVCADGELLTTRDIRQIDDPQNRWQDAPHHLPSQGLLLPNLIRLAAWMQQRYSEQESRQVSVLSQQVLDYFAGRLFTPTNSKAWWNSWGPKVMAYVEPILSEEQVQQVLGFAQRLHIVDVNFYYAEGHCKFQHQLLQEYLAAQQLAARPEDWQQLQRPWQAKALQADFYAAKQDLGTGDPLPPPAASSWQQTAQHTAAILEQPEAFIRQLLQQDILLAGHCASQAEVKNRLSASLISALQHHLLTRCQDAHTDLRVRIEAGLSLGRLGDHRFTAETNAQGVCFIRPSLVTVPAGTYTLGDNNSSRNNEKPQHQVRLAAFDLGQYPVTNKEWQCFMDAGGYDDERWWQSSEASIKCWQGELEQTEHIDWWLTSYQRLRDDFEGAIQRYYQHWTEYDIDLWRDYITASPEAFEVDIRNMYRAQKYRQPSRWDDTRFNNPSQPLVGICWYEALAYCQWLSHVTGEHYRLPSEAEWRATAHGVTGNRYAWGRKANSSFANTYETHLRRTTPVGMYEQGKTPRNKYQQSIYDLSGNVWEWCLSLYKDYSIQENDQRDDLKLDGSRITNGGAWGSSLDAARVECRDSTPPSYRSPNIGFRVLRELSS